MTANLALRGRIARGHLNGMGGLVNLNGVAKRMGVVKSTAYWHVSRPDFPAPVHYEGSKGEVRLWFVAEVDAYMAAR